MGRDRRRQPQRVPLTRDIGNTARIRKVVDAQHYLLDIGSRVGSPVIAFYIGSLVLVEGERVLATWREESSLWEIVGPIREPGQSLPGFVGVGFQEVAAGAGQFMHILGAGSDGTLGDPIADPATQPTAEVERIKWSHNNQWVAIVYSDQLSIYAWTGSVLGARLANVTLVDGADLPQRLGLSWNANDTLLAVGHDDAATGDGVTILTWDGATLTDVHNATLGGPAPLSATSCEWHPTNVNRLLVGQGNGRISMHTWNGTALVQNDIDGFGATTTDDVAFHPDGTFVVWTTRTSTRVRAVAWDEATLLFGTNFGPVSTPPNLISTGVAWNADGTQVLIANGAGDVVGYTFDGTFGSRVLGALVGATPIANDVVADPAGVFVAFATETLSAGGIYVVTMSFDGAAWTDVDSRASGGSLHLDGIAVGMPFGSVVPTEQLDASEITYDPADDTDWDVPPDDVAEALDDLADRLTGLSRIVDLPLNSFVIHTGTPAYAQVGTNMHAWAFDAAADELIVYSFTVPPKYASGGFFRYYYVMASATTNEVVVSADALPAVEGDDFDAAGTAATVADTVQAGASDDLGVVDVTPAVTYAAGDRVRAILGRLGADGSDNAAGDMWLVGVEFRYTAALL